MSLMANVIRRLVRQLPTRIPRSCRSAMQCSRRRLATVLLLVAVAALLLHAPAVSVVRRSLVRRHLLTVAGDRKLITYRADDEFWGLGNHMFALAATLATAHAQPGAWRLCVGRRSPLRSAFKSVDRLPECEADDVIDLLDPFQFVEQAYAKFDRTLRTDLPTDHHVVLDGYFQSWKYFADAEKLIRRIFRFSNDIQLLAHAAIADIIEQHVGCVGCYDNGRVVAVGVHVRRGDMAYDDQLRAMGYVTADQRYLARAMAHFDRVVFQSTPLTPANGRRVFVVCSDDIAWCRRNTPQRFKRDVVFVSTRDAFADLAVLARCRHSVVTVGTFGWWAAWLANGTTVYMRDWPRYGSDLYNGVSPEDYFPPRWVGL